MDEISKKRLAKQNKRVDKIMEDLCAMHARPGFTEEQKMEHIEATLLFIKNAALDYFDSYYDEDEPYTATFNLVEFLKDLEKQCDDLFVDLRKCSDRELMEEVQRRNLKEDK